MKTTKFAPSILVILGLFVLSFDGISQQAVPGSVFSALKVGNSKELAKFFNSTIELVILNKEGVYSKTQAELIMRDFFSKNVPIQDRFNVRHEAGKDASRYAICGLQTSKGQYRIYFLMKNNNGVFSIHQFRIEDDN